MKEVEDAKPRANSKESPKEHENNWDSDNSIEKQAEGRDSSISSRDSEFAGEKSKRKKGRGHNNGNGEDAKNRRLEKNR